MRIRTLLWIGSGDGTGAGAVSEGVAFDVAWARDVHDALALPVAAFDAVVVDAGRAGEAAAAVRLLREHEPEAPILVRLDPRERGEAGAIHAAGAGRVMLRSGRSDGREADALLAELDRLPPRPAPASAGPRAPRPRRRGLDVLVGKSRSMGRLRALAARAAGSGASVLVTGETGTGKELLARAIHEEGPRTGAAFVAVNCAAFPETLLESELFGHVRGAFTGADRDSRGLFAAADGGTLFLDEVGETSASLQAKLLRVLQEREVRPVGGTRPRPVDVRVIAATNRDLEEEVARGRFREDLFYRLAVFPIRMPGLRERAEDVLPLACHFLERHAGREGKAGCTLSPEAEELLALHAWPGNVRELENEIQRALALVEPGDALRPEHLSDRLTAAHGAVHAATARAGTLAEAMARVEAWFIRRALAENAGRRTATARRLGITREGLYKKMKRLGIE